jgi:uncharacterized protein (DUF302 family)
MTKRTQYSYSETKARLAKAIIFGNPKGGTPIMDSFSLSGVAVMDRALDALTNLVA